MIYVSHIFKTTLVFKNSKGKMYVLLTIKYRQHNKHFIKNTLQQIISQKCPQNIKCCGTIFLKLLERFSHTDK